MKLAVRHFSIDCLCRHLTLPVGESWQYPLGTKLLLLVFRQGIGWHGGVWFEEDGRGTALQGIQKAGGRLEVEGSWPC